MQDIMVDLETLGVTPGCVILSIGAVAFGPDGLGQEFHVILNTEDCERAGLFVEPETVEFWSRQDQTAKRVLAQAASPTESLPLRQALEIFSTFLAGVGPPSELRLHGNGSDFDNALLAVAYHRAQMKAPWKFYNTRCHRTNKAKGDKSEGAGRVEREGVLHDALDDAKHQARQAISLANSGIPIFC